MVSIILYTICIYPVCIRAHVWHSVQVKSEVATPGEKSSPPMGVWGETQVHSLGSECFLFNRTISPTLRYFVTCVLLVPDIPGHGHISDKPPSTWEAEEGVPGQMELQ